MVNINRSCVGRGWDQVPLCRSYALALFSDCCVDVRQQGTVGRWRFSWAVGMLTDGQHDMLGLWHGPEAAETDWQLVADALLARGVEKIQFVAFMESTRDESGMRGSVVWPSISQLLHLRGSVSTGHCPTHTTRARTDLHSCETPGDCAAKPGAVNPTTPVASWWITGDGLDPLRAMPPRFRSVVRLAESAVKQLNHRLSQATNRKGCFPSLHVASSFFTETLARAERGLDCRATSSATVVRHRAVRAIERPGIAGSAR